MYEIAKKYSDWDKEELKVISGGYTSYPINRTCYLKLKTPDGQEMFVEMTRTLPFSPWYLSQYSLAFPHEKSDH